MQKHTHDLVFTADEVHKRFVTWDDGEADREWRCLSAIHEHARGVAPRPLRREMWGSRPVVVTERLPGDPLGDRPLSAEQTVALGRALSRLYAIPVDAIAAAAITERRYGPSTLPQLLSQWPDEPYDLSQCRERAEVAIGVDTARAWLEDSPALPEPRLVGLGISDLNPANILWDGESCRLVDFEDGGLTDPSYDLADHVEHIAGRLSGVFDADRLADAVGLSPEDRARMQAYRPLWAIFWLVMLLPGNGAFRRNPPGTTEVQARHLMRLLR
ncbi:aminoglycoside phosphotransferase family protein [Microbacterium paludicola]|uniref:aminoglycoside phosphotransferase family protein n=1 Tax=Microbacterium paludicola TaxID=300019 RepID=UPI0031D50D7F